MILDIMGQLQLEERHRSFGLLSMTRVLTAINFLATGSYQRSVGQNFLLPVSQSTVSRCVTEFTRAMQRLGSLYIKFPQESEFASIKQRFYDIAGFPGVVALVDGSHIKIKSPEKDIEHIYYCRKGGHSKNVQFVCGPDLEIYSVNAKFGGTAHDAYIWRSSQVKNHVEQLYNNGSRDFWILGDSGYPLQPWLMTPVGETDSESKDAYNRAHKKTRHKVECAIGVLKSRFRCLLQERVLCYTPKKCGDIINTCVMLNNIMVRARIEMNEEYIIFDDPNDFDMNETSQTSNTLLRIGQSVQRRIIENFFC